MKQRQRYELYYQIFRGSCEFIRQKVWKFRQIIKLFRRKTQFWRCPVDQNVTDGDVVCMQPTQTALTVNIFFRLSTLSSYGKFSSPKNAKVSREKKRTHFEFRRNIFIPQLCKQLLSSQYNLKCFRFKPIFSLTYITLFANCNDAKEGFNSKCRIFIGKL